MKKILMTTIAAMTLTACGGAGSDDTPMVDKPEFTSTDGVFSIDALEALGRVSDPQLSPDGTKLLYTVSYESVEHNRSNADLYLLELANPTEVKRLTATPKSESNAKWFDGGKKIAFLYPDADGKSQVWTMDADGGNRRQASKLEKAVNGFLISPDEKKIVLIQQIKFARTAQDVYPDLPKANA
ncbi:MAG: peptidase S9, partial [Muribaculaceae bacterium]|nr:peptidase S9 [Muribaculaceae bacterium]